MKFFKMLFIFTISLCFIIGSIYYYAFKIEPYRIHRKHFFIKKEIPSKQYVKIIQFSDVHIKEDFTYKNLQSIVEKINAENPDIVIFTGDLYDNYAKYNDDTHIIEQLKRIKVKYSKLAIWGNHDYGGGAARQYETIMKKSGFSLLKNEDQILVLENKKQILFTGLDDGMLGKPNFTPIHTKTVNFHILLTHEPDIIANMDLSFYDLILSGHSHGGQINIPFLPMLNKKAVAMTLFSNNYSSGMYTIDSDTQLYVNTGIGMTHISARLGVVPEITIFYVYL